MKVIPVFSHVNENDLRAHFKQFKLLLLVKLEELVEAMVFLLMTNPIERAALDEVKSWDELQSTQGRAMEDNQPPKK